MNQKVPAIFAIILVILLTIVFFLFLRSTLQQFETEKKVELSGQLLRGVQWAVRGPKDSCDLLIQKLEEAELNDSSTWHQYLEDLKTIRDKFEGAPQMETEIKQDY